MPMLYCRHEPRAFSDSLAMSSSFLSIRDMGTAPGALNPAHTSGAVSDSPRPTSPAPMTPPLRRAATMSGSPVPTSPAPAVHGFFHLLPPPPPPPLPPPPTA